MGALGVVKTACIIAHAIFGCNSKNTEKNKKAIFENRMVHGAKINVLSLHNYLTAPSPDIGIGQAPP
jgi:hypothetical protein